MKTTLDIPDELFDRIKKLAVEQRTSLKAIVTQALVDFLGPYSDVKQPLQIDTWPPTDHSQSTLSSEDILQIIRCEREGKRFTQTSDHRPGTDEQMQNDSSVTPSARKSSRVRKKT